MMQVIALIVAEQEVILALHQDGRTSRHIYTMTNRSLDAFLSIIRRVHREREECDEHYSTGFYAKSFRRQKRVPTRPARSEIAMHHT